MNTKVLATGCVIAMSLLVSGTSGQTSGQTVVPRPQTTPAAQSSQPAPDVAASEKDSRSVLRRLSQRR